MAEFKESQKKYIQAKNAFRVASKELYLARQQILLLEQNITDLLREGMLTALPAGHTLSVQRTAAIKKLVEKEAAFASASNELGAARLAFNSFGTSALTLANMDDSTPILLLPLRIQTRFLTIKHIARNCPDEFLVDINKVAPATREMIRSVFPDLRPQEQQLATISSQAKTLSNNQSSLAKRLLVELNKATGFIPPQKRWQKIVDAYELWVRIFPDDICLQSHEPALTEKELAAAKIFWQSMWEAERDFRSNHTDLAAALRIKEEKQLEAWKKLRVDILHHRANWIARVMRPVDFPDNLSVDIVKLSPAQFPDPGLKSDSWTIPPYTEILPESYTVKVFFKNPAIPPKEISGSSIPDKVILGFDPDEKDENSFSGKGKVLELPSSIRWLTDINEAEKMGMAVRVPLSQPEFLAGISKLVVIGIKAGADETEGAKILTTLFDNHHYKPDGMAFLPQGTSTNNLPGQVSGFSQAGLPDEVSFKNELSNKPVNDPTSDGRRLETALGLEENFFATISNNDRFEGEEALQLNRALWAGTLGYYLDNHMRPNLTNDDINFTKTFFQNFVTGRGLLPSFRVGKQPYGIIPSTAWSAWKTDANASLEEKRLVNFLKKMDEQWSKLAGRVKTMKKIFEITDEQQLKKEFRELLAFQASSTRFFRRLVAGEYMLWNVNKMSVPPGTEKVGIRTTPNIYKTKLESAEGWNEPVNPRPQILGKFFDDDYYKLFDFSQDTAGLNLVNDRGLNYLSILLDSTVDQLKANSYGEDFNKFVSQRSSRLMFYLTRFALLQGWVDAATGLLKKDKNVISPLARLDFEMEYILDGTEPSLEHKSLLSKIGTRGNFETRKNKWSFFDQVLNDGTKTISKVADRLMDKLQADDPVKNLQNTRHALEHLAKVPVDRLERLMSEHVDLCSFRLDAWLQGLALSRLFANRKKQGFEKGIFIGSFGYLENLMPGKSPWIQVKEITNPGIVDTAQRRVEDVVMPVYDFTGLTPAQIKIAKKFVFIYLGSDPATMLKEDPVTKNIIQSNTPIPVEDGGYVLTPSLEHAATAGILRAGYEHHSLSQGAESKTLAVNISSERTGWAIDMLKAVKAGHSLNEQLGYFIERKMYDNPMLAQFIPALRLAFPLHIERNEWDDDQQINEKNKISNLALVTDGLAIITKNQSPAIAPGWNDKLTEIFPNQQTAKNEFGKVVGLAIEQFDAVSDLVLAESVFQTVKGSPERAAAALRMLGDAGDITLPDVVNIPAESRVLTHRVGFVLNSTVNLQNAWPAGSAPVSLYARLSPDLNRWLADQLPAPNRIVAKIITTDNSLLKVRILSTGIQAIDFFYLLKKSGYRPEESLLTWLFAEAAKKTPGIDPKKIIGVSFDRDKSFSVNELSIREILPLVISIGSMLQIGRPMRPTDFLILPDEVNNPTNNLYDNTSLQKVCRDYSDNSATGPIVAYIENMNKAITALEANLPVGFGSPASDAAFGNLIRLIPQSFLLGSWDATPRCPDECNAANASVLIDQGLHVIDLLTKRLEVVNTAFSELAQQILSVPADKLFDKLSKLAGLFVGEDFIILPGFVLPDQKSIKATFNDPTLAASIGKFGVEEWLQGLSMVRENLGKYQFINNLRMVFNAIAANRRIKIMQLPVVAGGNNNWIGAMFPENYVPPPQVTSLAYEFSTTFNPALPLSGIIIDDWREKVPLPVLTAGVSIKFDQVNAEAPQCLLLVVAPEIKGAWDWESVVNAVIETMALAKKRAVDGEMIQSTWLSQFLPAIVTSN